MFGGMTFVFRSSEFWLILYPKKWKKNYRDCFVTFTTCPRSYIFTVPPKLNPFLSTVLQLNVGDRASLTCSVIKGDLPLTITWRKDNRIIDASQQISIKQVDHYNSILVIENLGPDHTGNYTCSVIIHHFSFADCLLFADIYCFFFVCCCARCETQLLKWKSLNHF